MTASFEDQLKVLQRGTVEIIPNKEFEAKLKESIKNRKPLKVKLGLDPTAPDIHIGHTVVLNKLKQFQDLGHQVILIIGSFTGMIGDPSGRNEMRIPLTKNAVTSNAKTYEKQVFKILNKRKTKIQYNDKWLAKLTSTEVVHLTGQYTVARMLERDDFAKRYKDNQPIGIHEVLYPLFQGYDSVAVESDIELGGTDQTFNLLVGREIQKAYGKKQQCILTMPLLEGLDGMQKMSKSLGNHIGITENPRDMFGKIMRISDEMMWKYYELLSSVSLDKLAAMRKEVEAGRANPRDIKAALGEEIVAKYHDQNIAQNAHKEFNEIFKKGGTPDEIETLSLKISGEIPIQELILQVGCVSSKGEARRLIEQGGVLIDNKKVTDPFAKIFAKGELLLKVGKRRFRKIKFT